MASQSERLLVRGGFYGWSRPICSAPWPRSGANGTAGCGCLLIAGIVIARHLARYQGERPKVEAVLFRHRH